MIRTAIASFMKQKIKRVIWFALTAGAMAATFNSSAVDVQLTAEFKPDITNPNKNKFINTTPKGGVCSWYGEICQDNNVFSIIVPGHFGYKNFDPKSTDWLRNGLGYVIDARTKNIILTEEKTGKRISVAFRLNMLGVKFRKTTPGGQWWDLITYGKRTLGGCNELNKLGYPNDIDYVIGLPYAISSCWGELNSAASWTGEIGIPILSFGYTLTTPNPLEVSSGVYEGEVVYNVNGNSNNGINLGTERQSNDEVRFKIRANVEHAFFYNFPAGSQDVKLSPPEGWSRWINGGEIPNSLRKEVPFTLTTSQPFRIKMLCQYAAGQACALQKNGGTEQVPLDLKITIPGLKTTSGSEVNNFMLNNSPDGTLLTNSGTYITNRRSALNFQIQRPAVETMVREKGSVWKGGVTLIFDTEI